MSANVGPDTIAASAQTVKNTIFISLAGSVYLFATDVTAKERGEILQAFVDLIIFLVALPAELALELPVAPVALVRHLS